MIRKYIRWVILSGLLPAAGGIVLVLWLLQRRRQGLQQSPVTPGRIVLPEAPEPEPAPEARPQSEPVPRPGAEAGETKPVMVKVPAAQPAVDRTPEPDDLTALEGIGPKIAGVLKMAGILTFAQLAAMDVAQLKALLKEGGIRIANSDTWPEQAALAARGDWDGLAALQGSLKGGRRA
ncbi:MAG: hypothetical protein JW934_16840 [Anaerolineae bacterium]|nr:hypothetical protein [Anaerolineae bacterium]